MRYGLKVEGYVFSTPDIKGKRGFQSNVSGHEWVILSFLFFSCNVVYQFNFCTECPIHRHQ
jgi:hypothetical protein